MQFDSGIENLGSDGTGVFSIKWYVDGREVGAYGGHDGVPGDTLVAGGNSQFAWTIDTPGTHTVSFAVDVDNHVLETNENNNATAVTFEVVGTASGSGSGPGQTGTNDPDFVCITGPGGTCEDSGTGAGSGTGYDAIVTCFGSNPCGDAERRAADLNRDGVVDGIDYNLWLRNQTPDSGGGDGASLGKCLFDVGTLYLTAAVAVYGSVAAVAARSGIPVKALQALRLAGDVSTIADLAGFLDDLNKGVNYWVALLRTVPTYDCFAFTLEKLEQTGQLGAQTGQALRRFVDDLNGVVRCLPEAMYGRWTGTVDQPNSTPGTYAATLTLEAGCVGDSVGTADYPDLRCGGQLTAAAGGRATLLREKITYGLNRCVDEDDVRLDFQLDGTIRVEYYVGSALYATGVLVRQTS